VSGETDASNGSELSVELVSERRSRFRRARMLAARCREPARADAGTLVAICAFELERE